MWKVVYTVQIQCRECQQLPTNGQQPLHLLAEAILGFRYIKSYHQVNNRGKYADGFHDSMMDDKDGHIPSQLIMFICTALRHALLEWQINNGVPPKGSKSMLKADRPHRSNSFNYRNDSGKNTSCCAALGRKLLLSPGVADTYTLTWGDSPEVHINEIP